MIIKFLSKLLGHQNVKTLSLLRRRLLPIKEPQFKINFYQQFFTKGDLVFDVGANDGNRTRPFLEIGAKVIAVEPLSSCYRHLKREFGNKVVVINKGCGAKEEVKDFYVCDLDVLSTFSEEFINTTNKARFSEQKWDRKERKEIITLDKLIEQYGLPQFIKIDVEGFEPEVLKGLRQKVPYLSFEYTVPELKKNIVECVEMLSSINSNALYNYSMEETLVLAGDWLTKEKILQLIDTDEFAIKADFGDIYVKN
jgi:FkbM family methyltransferase